MSKADELENAIANVAQPGNYLPEVLPAWMESLGIIPRDLITSSTRIGTKSPTNKTDVLIKLQNSPPIKVSAKLSNADYFGNWYGHERLIKEFGKDVFSKMTARVTEWANQWADHSNTNIFVGVSISFGSRVGNTFIPFLDIFDSSDELLKIVAGAGEGDNVANCLYVSNDHLSTITDILANLSPINSQSVKAQSEDIKIICRPINPMTEGSNRGKNVYTKFEPYQRQDNKKTITTLTELMKLGKFTQVEPNKLNHNHILNSLEQDYNIFIRRQ